MGRTGGAAETEGTGVCNEGGFRGVHVARLGLAESRTKEKRVRST
jgi:hypothetical protein